MNLHGSTHDQQLCQAPGGNYLPLSNSKTLKPVSIPFNLLLFSSPRKFSTLLIIIILPKMVSPTALLKGALLVLPSLVAATGQLGFSLGVKHNPVSYSVRRVLWITDSYNRVRMEIASIQMISRRISI